MNLLGVHHISINVRELDAAICFYRDALELAPLERPDLGFAGAWFALGDGRELHLVEAPDSKPARGQHFAFRVRDIERTTLELSDRGVRCSEVRSLPGGGRQCFFVDPSGNLLELNQPMQIEPLQVEPI